MDAMVLKELFLLRTAYTIHITLNGCDPMSKMDSTNHPQGDSRGTHKAGGKTRQPGRSALQEMDAEVNDLFKRR